MKKQVTWFFVVVAVLGIILWTVVAQTQKEASVVWEYKAISSNNPIYEPPLNQLGVEGWDLVSVTSSCPKDANCQVHAYFKRRR